MRWGICVALLMFACGPKPNGHPPGGDDDDGPVPDGAVTPMDAMTCGNQTEMIGVVNLGDPPDLLVLLDRSGSMQSPPPQFPPIFTPKWTIMKNGLTSVVTSKDQQIKFGLL